MSNKVKAVCDICKFKLTAGDAEVGDICPWCKRGALKQPESEQ